MRVSVVIVSWNAKKYLEECLNSLGANVCKFPMEIIVVDNASTDGTVEMVEKNFPDVKLIKNAENLGFAKANNIGIREASGDYIALVNSDVHVLDNCITDLVEYCEAHAEIGMVGPYIEGGDGKQQRSCRGFPSLWNMFCRALALDVVFPNCKLFGGYFMTYWNHNTSRPVDILSGCFWLARKKSLDDVGLLDELFFIYGEDMDWCKRFSDKGWPIVFFPQAKAIHYGGGSSANAPVRFFIEKQKADLQYWKKHHSGLAYAGYLVISIVHHSLRALGHALVYLLKIGKSPTSQYKIKRELACLKWMLNLKNKAA